MSAGKTLNTGNALYGNIVRALSGDEILPKMVALDGGSDTASQPTNIGYNEFVSGLSFTNTQGITRDASNWFGIDTADIYKYNLSGTQVAANTSPFTSLPAGVDHCGDGFVFGSYLYVPIVEYDSGTQTATNQCIVKFNISDLTYDSHFDISAQTDCNGSGLALSPDESEIYVTSFNTGTPDDRNVDIYRFNLTTGAYIGIHTLDTDSIGTQGLTYGNDLWFVASWVSPNSYINVYNAAFEFQTQIRVVFDLTEMEGVCFYDGEVYFHKVGSTVRRLDFYNMAIGKLDGSGSAFLDSADMSDECTILMRLYPMSLYNFNSLFDNKTDANHWESWIYSDGRLAFRVNSGSNIVTAASTISAKTEYVIGVTWDNNSGTVSTKLNLDGVAKGTASGAWITPPTLGLWLGAGNASNTQGDSAYKDILVFDKVLSDTELTDAYNDFSDFYVADGSGISITESVVNTNYASLDPTISLTSSISVTESLANVNYETLDPTVTLTTGISIVEGTVNTNYLSLDPVVTLTSSALQITESTVSVQYQSNDPSILLTPEPIGIVSTVCFNGVLVDLEYNGEFNELEFNGTIQTTCNTSGNNTAC